MSEENSSIPKKPKKKPDYYGVPEHIGLIEALKKAEQILDGTVCLSESPGYPSPIDDKPDEQP